MKTPLPPLPVDSLLPDVTRTALAGKAVVLSSPPGSGKTTRVPGALVDAGITGEVVVLEPRRLAARAAARRVAEERGVGLGDEVGYQVRHDRRVSAATRIRFVTEGVLLRELVGDPTLERVGAVVLDEFHERHAEGDLVVAMLQEVRATIRPELAIVVMSATLDCEPLRAFLDGEIVCGAGRLHPVEVRHADRVAAGALEDRVRAAVVTALAETGGDVLVFLPGVGEIASCEQRLRGGEFDLVPLHGSLDAAAQDRALRPGPRRKVVLSTNVAESSVTVPGVTAVVDSGLARVLRHDPARGFDALRVERISRAAADQRAGRAGREGPGLCMRLWAAAEERSMPAFDTPELHRIDLGGPALQVRAFAARDPLEFGWFEAPDSAALHRADRSLVRLGALSGGGRITEVGRRMLALPLPPRLARLMLAAVEEDAVADAADVAAMLAERDFERRRSTGALIERLETFQRLRASGFSPALARASDCDAGAARAVARASDQIAGALRRSRSGRGRPRAAEPSHARDGARDGLRRALLAAFPDRVLVRSSAGAEFGVLADGRGARLVGPGHEAERLLVAVEAREPTGRDRSRAVVSQSCAIERAWLEQVVPGSVCIEQDAELDATRGQVVAVRRVRFLRAVLEEQRGGECDPAAVERLLVGELTADPWRHLGEQRELRAFLCRLAWLREQMPEAALPVLGDAEVVAAARSFLADRRSLRHLAEAAVLPILRAGLGAAARATIEREAPERVRLPSGRLARIDYESGGQPFVAARLQELFGMVEVPRLAGGRVPLLVHLLAPNQRPVQVTSDLRSFWTNVYPGVRAELRRRYPKHAWPEDPWTARAEARPQRRR